MIKKIKILTDSTSDITDIQAKELDITLVYVPVIIDGVSYYERIDLPTEEFYVKLKAMKTKASTSHATPSDFLEAYKRVYKEGYTDVIIATITSTTSGMFNAANMAVEMLYEEFPQAKETIAFHILDSRNYSGAYGYAVVKAAMMRDEGKTVTEILNFMQDHFDHTETYLSIFDLKYAKKSGRVSGAQAFIGDALGLRPIISVIDGEMKTFAKVRGDGKALEKLADLFVENTIDLNYDFVILGGESLEPAKILEELIFEKTGKRPFDTYRCGAALSVNSGPTIIGVLVRGKDHTK